MSFSVGVQTFTCDFDNLPNNSHAQWFLRLGLAVRNGHVKNLDEITAATPGYRNATSANDWYLGKGLGENYFGAFSDALGLPPSVETYLRRRYSTFRFLDGPKRFASISFRAKSVRESIEASADFLAANPRVERLRPAQVVPIHETPDILSALASSDESMREWAVLALLDDPSIRLDTEWESQLGAQIAEHAAAYGLTLKDGRDWLSLAELLTVPYLRCWPKERLSGMLARMCAASAGEGIRPGVVGDRIIAAAVLDGRLDEVLEDTKRVVAHRNWQPHRGAGAAEMLTFGEEARYLHDGVAIGRFTELLATEG